MTITLSHVMRASKSKSRRKTDDGELSKSRGQSRLRRQVRAQEFDRRPHGGCGDGQAHQSLALLDVYRGRGWGHPRNQQGGKTKVTKRSIAEVPARWFFCWRFGRRGDLRASLRQNGIDLFLDLPRVSRSGGVAAPGATIVPS